MYTSQCFLRMITHTSLTKECSYVYSNMLSNHIIWESHEILCISTQNLLLEVVYSMPMIIGSPPSHIILLNNVGS